MRVQLPPTLSLSLTLSLALTLTLAVTLPALPGRAAFLRDVPVQARQPDGSVASLRVTGDEAHARAHDAAGFTVVRDPATGFLVYADLADGRLAPTPLAAFASDPAAAGIVPGLDDAVSFAPRPRGARSAGYMPASGTVTGLVVFVAFADEEIFPEALADWDALLTSADPAARSVRNYYAEVSRGALDVRSLLLPPPSGDQVAFYVDPNPRFYYTQKDGGNPWGYETDAQAVERERALLRAALDAILPLVPADADLDADDDGYVDNVIFVCTGFPTVWSGLLWPHQWELPGGPFVNGAQVYAYNVQFTTMRLLAPSVFLHEMFHSIGSPDLYHYSQDGIDPTGPWDVMGTSGMYAPHMLAHMKRLYGGWLPPLDEITAPGVYELFPSWAAGPQAMRLPAPGAPGQAFVLEYRRAEGTFESALPGSGLIAYRVDDSLAGLGNRNGPPDEVWVLRPGSGAGANGTPEAANLSADSGRTVLTESSDPAFTLQDGTPVVLRVFDVGPAGDSIRFRVCLDKPDCGDKACGDDGCGGSCGTCGEGLRCDANACVPCTCDGRACGDDGCGVACGTGSCDDGDPCTVETCEAWQCVAGGPAPAGTACDDGDPCTTGDACDGAGVCAGEGECVPEPAPEPVVESAPDASIEPSPEPSPEPAPEPVPDPVPEPVPEAVPDPGPAPDAASLPDGVPDAARPASSGCAAGGPAGGLAIVLLLGLPMLAVLRGPRRRPASSLPSDADRNPR